MNFTYSDAERQAAAARRLRAAGMDEGADAAERVAAELVRYCPDCNGYGSSLKLDADTCPTCGGTGEAPS